jgi:hypothetical protein
MASDEPLSPRERFHRAARAAAANGKPRASKRPSTPQPEPAEPADRRPTMFTAAALLRMELPEPRFAVNGLVPEGLSLLAGKPKLGKSWLALNLAVAVALGGKALGQIAVEAGDVLYLALEDTRRRLKDRLQKLLGAQESRPPERLHLATEWPRQDKGGLFKLACWLDEYPQARLVVIDTWAKFKPGRGHNGDKYEEDYQHAAEVKAIADSRGVALLILHHCRKLGAVDPLEEVSGTLGLTGAADAVLVLRRERGQHDAALFVTGRDVEEQELALRWDPEYALWSVIGEANEYRVSKERSEVLEIFRQAGKPLTPGAAAGLLGKKPNTIKQLLWLMARDGQLIALGDGHYMLTSSNPANRANPTNRPNHTNQTSKGSVNGG